MYIVYYLSTHGGGRFAVDHTEGISSIEFLWWGCNECCWIIPDLVHPYVVSH